MSIVDTSKLFGLSHYALRKGIKDGSIKHTMVGNKYLIDVWALSKQLEGNGKVRQLNELQL